MIQATYSYQSHGTRPDREHSSSIYYAVAGRDPREAIDGFKRWWDNRAVTVPEIFRKLLAVKLYRFEPHPINPDGSLKLAPAEQLYEWKCDWGIPYGMTPLLNG